MAHCETITWTCDKKKFLEVVSSRSYYIEKLGNLLQCEWFLEITFDCKPVSSSVTYETLANQTSAYGAPLQKEVKYCYYLLNFNLKRNSHDVCNNIISRLISGTKIIAKELSFFNNRTSLALGTVLTEVFEDIHLVIHFSKNPDIDLELEERVETSTNEVIISKSGNLSDDFQSLFNAKEGTDVVLKCGNIGVKAHKLILSCRSPVFKNYIKLIEDNEIKALRDAMRVSGHIELAIENVDPSIFHDFIAFIYTGKLKVKSLIAVEKLRVAGIKYKIPSLEYAINDYMCGDYDTENRNETVVQELISSSPAIL